MDWLQRLKETPKTEPGQTAESPQQEQPTPDCGRDLPHYCEPGGCWCSEKLHGNDYPAGCIRQGCEYHEAAL
jgi:hypothetical protein